MVQKNVIINKFSGMKLGSLIAVCTMLCMTPLVNAEELVISGNGAGSTNEIINSPIVNTSITQANNLNSDTDVTTTSNTGENSTSGNIGTSEVTTGNVTTDVIIANSGNVNTSDQECCQTASENTAVISGNANGTDNYINISGTQLTNISGNNTANIVNIISGNANTGNNTASYNSNGNTLIKTGSISVTEKIWNGPINYNNAATVVNNANIKSLDIKIKENGAYSINKVSINDISTTNIVVNNALDILNESVWILNSGHNYADNNTNGNVKIITGDISFLADIVNGPINVNSVKVTCCEDKEPEQQNPTTPPPSTANVETKINENKSSDGSKSGTVFADAIGQILPVTGNYNLLLFLIGNVAMLLMGTILRLRSGRSPTALQIVV